MWRAINTLTKGHSPANNNLPSELTPDVFNAHFVSVSLCLCLCLCLSHQTFPLWLNTNIKQAMLLRGKCIKQNKFVEYKQQRNRVNYCVREPRKNILMTVPEIKQIYHPCGELSTLTKGHSLQTIIFHQNSHQTSLTPTSYL